MTTAAIIIGLVLGFIAGRLFPKAEAETRTLTQSVEIGIHEHLSRLEDELQKIRAAVIGGRKPKAK